MVCEGYEHGSRVRLVRSIAGIPVPPGVRGGVVGVDRLAHKLDVQFDNFGRFDGLDAHAFAGDTGDSSTGRGSVRVRV